MPQVPRVAVSMGDPFGIGPEIIVKTLADESLRRRAAYLVFGVEAPFLHAARAAGIPVFWKHLSIGFPSLPPATMNPGDVVLIEGGADVPEIEAALTMKSREPSAASGRASMHALEAAVVATQRPASHPLHADALVTAPISKTAWNLAGFKEFPGHTELLAARYGANRHAMLFVGRSLRVILVTIHIPLSRVPGAITTPAVLDAIELGAAACRQLGIANPRVAVCGVNPHAGEHGLLGEEDDRVILPAIDAARSRGVLASGPFPADAVFLPAVKGEYDLVVAMYHDQGLIPIKLIEREQTVNVTVGLPHPREPNRWMIRTSPAHGTAFDIAGSNRASEASMKAAIELALTLTRTSAVASPSAV